MKKKAMVTGLTLGLFTVLASGCGVYSTGKDVNKHLSIDGKNIQALDIEVSTADIEIGISKDDKLSLSLTGSVPKNPEKVLTTSVDGSTYNVQVKPESAIGVNLVGTNLKLNLQ